MGKHKNKDSNERKKKKSKKHKSKDESIKAVLDAEIEFDPILNWKSIQNFYDPLMSGCIDGTDTEPHDKAVVRAINSKYYPSKAAEFKSASTLFVGRLSSTTDESKLKHFFEHYGKLKHVKIIRDWATGEHRHYGFIEFKHSRDAEIAESDCHSGTMLDNSEILVDFEFSHRLPGWIPRRLGGGYGGRKESGQLRFGGKARPYKKPTLEDF